MTPYARARVADKPQSRRYRRKRRKPWSGPRPAGPSSCTGPSPDGCGMEGQEAADLAELAPAARGPGNPRERARRKIRPVSGLGASGARRCWAAATGMEPSAWIGALDPFTEPLADQAR